MVLECVLCAVLGMAPTLPVPDIAAFQNLSAQERVDAAVAILQRREAELQNFSFTLQESTFDIDGTPAVREQLDNTYVKTIRRIGGKTFQEGKNFTKDAPVAEYWVGWDGTLQKGYTSRPPDEHQGQTIRGVVKDSEYAAMRESAYNHILGFRLKAETPITLPECIQARRKNEGGVDVSVDAGLLAVKTEPGPGMVETYWLDPQRDFMPVRFSHRSRVFEDHEVVEAKKVDGLWVPTKVVARSGFMATSQHVTEVVCQVTAFTRNTVTDKDVTVEFPPGTEVVDFVRRIAYRVTKAGTIELMPLYDTQTGKMLDPRDRPLEAALADAEQFRLAATMPARPAPATHPHAAKSLSFTPVGPGGWTWPWFIVAAGVILLAWGLVRARAKRNDRRPGSD